MVSAIAQTSNTLLIGPIADKYSVWSSFRAAKPPQNNMKRGGKIIEATLYMTLYDKYPSLFRSKNVWKSKMSLFFWKSVRAELF